MTKTVTTDEVIAELVNNSDLENVLVICQGVSGSGKSTFMQKLARVASRRMNTTVEVNEADNFFVNDEGEYVWDGKFIGEAHEWCRSSVARALYHDGFALVCNTFTSARELAPYYELAKKADVDVVLIRMGREYGNVHNVPEAALNRQRDRMRSNTQYTPHFIVVD